MVAPWQAEHFVVVFWIFVELQLATGASCAVVLELLSDSKHLTLWLIT